MQENEKLVRQISAFGIWLLAVNGMIGAGIFGVPAAAAALTGAWSPLVFAACGVLLTAVVLCFAELASYFRGTGGPVLYVHEAFGNFAGFETGWAFYIARVTAFAANINLLVASVAWFWPPLAQGMPRIFMLGLIMLVLTVPNVLGTRHGMRFIGFLTILKFVPLLVLVAAGLPALSPELLEQARAFPGATDFVTAALLVIYAFVGWEAAVIPAGETRNPARDMPRALIAAILIVTLLYVLVQIVALAVHPDLAASKRPLVDVGAALFGPFGALLLTAAVVVSVGGNVASTMVTGPRLTYSLARDGAFPAWFGKVHPAFHTPANSVIFLSVVVFALAVYGSFAWLAAMSALVRVMIYLVCIGALPRLRRRFGDAPDRFRIPGGWLIPGAAFIVSAVLLLQVNVESITATAFSLLAGAAIYFWMMRNQRRGL